jgi:hypothetical protein
VTSLTSRAPDAVSNLSAEGFGNWGYFMTSPHRSKVNVHGPTELAEEALRLPDCDEWISAGSVRKSPNTTM